MHENKFYQSQNNYKKKLIKTTVCTLLKDIKIIIIGDNGVLHQQF